jgi:hypothetical protein
MAKLSTEGLSIPSAVIRLVAPGDRGSGGQNAKGEGIGSARLNTKINARRRKR